MTEEQTKASGKQSFIAEARREQIMNAAIQTLNEIGYVKASLAQIAKRAGISTGLISYHFSDKSDLMNHLLMNLVEKSATYILERVHRTETATAKLSAFIDASLAYQGTQPMHFTALVEIVFNARTPDNTPYYKLEDELEEDILLCELIQILRTGQEQGEFGTFNVYVMANSIQGAIGEYMSSSSIRDKVDLEAYSKELIQTFEKATKA
ncbi:TetR/AcrR family transcriptional regulator [Priestia taiwanensis]|uniref:TetR family transcriptional regulator n=1 Tax=Priestia taiwanensis TaxID=1347902 RepID=A0A917ELZ9_9BACI|nr:TetR/AcrR family transcriptional regulator [Priestia taiwanensis]MBM7362366.1 AcrR family transcriptional regulator [Priestia taiwanensis]GGE61606.1 TetR family transcriptional regulator [Priestia taiwanensis]